MELQIGLDAVLEVGCRPLLHVGHCAAQGGTTPEKEAKLAADIPVGRVASTEEIAAVITFLSSQDAGYLTGTTVDINGGSHIH
jgi:NAD(P)-dependent dehydrogenase (short-subunit alcohol dehydrogenase family)